MESYSGILTALATVAGVAITLAGFLYMLKKNYLDQALEDQKTIDELKNGLDHLFRENRQRKEEIKELRESQDKNLSKVENMINRMSEKLEKSIGDIAKEFRTGLREVHKRVDENS
jgi:DNA anti-recombination protein RmuC